MLLYCTVYDNGHGRWARPNAQDDGWLEQGDQCPSGTGRVQILSEHLQASTTLMQWSSFAPELHNMFGDGLSGASAFRWEALIGLLAKFCHVHFYRVSTVQRTGA